MLFAVHRKADCLAAMPSVGRALEESSAVVCPVVAPSGSTLSGRRNLPLRDPASNRPAPPIGPHVACPVRAAAVFNRRSAFTENCKNRPTQAAERGGKRQPHTPFVNG